MSNREKGGIICKEFTIRRQAIRQVVYINLEQKTSQNSEVIPSQEEFWPFNSTLRFRYFKKSFKRYNRFSDMPLQLNFRISPSCQTLSMTLNMSKNTLLSSGSLSKDWCSSWVIKRSWFMKSHRVECLTVWMIIRDFHEKACTVCYIKVSNILQQIRSKGAGR